MTRFAFLAPVALSFTSALYVACSSSDSHSPFAGGGCDGCLIGPPIGGNGNPGTDGGTSSTRDGGGGIGDLIGDVRVFRDTSFTTTSAFTGDGTIVALGAHKVTGSFIGSSFTLTGTDRQSPLWVGISATTGSNDILPTVAAVDGTAQTVTLAFARVSDFATIVAGATLNPVSVRSDRAQAFISFASSNGQFRTGMQITQSTAQDVLYDTGSSYSDTLGMTDARGVAVLVNLTGGATLPGDRTTLTYADTTTKKAGTFDVYLARGALTVVAVLVP